ncbi:LLM class flavin-dependent oxidoreductase [Halanaeroarchaeum sp. HSR-CO]|uniref:TIGR04024 family LLM class F420-dependent oxidoreductase n=1 Tax=Halanaeroarchaeum sp. HSR-CO TaxID=2866382 RepID=UPI00217E6146|nr:TIGR04024 family LLM class F420-dependent oxidoreductase [Halanaeroarchaeum sp. HSR-CO]UWG47887.1 LLM class flavin-dependent oxidoreductase [Halanaeroarchaeum sp. HSR-CO]
MTELDLHLPVAEQPSVDHYVDYAVHGERHGYGVAWVPETWGRNVVPVLTEMARATDSIGLGPSILNVFSRSPALIGQTAATLQEVTDGRARIGVGSSGPIVIEGWHGASFEQALKRVRESVEIAKQVQTGESVDYDGSIFSLAGFRLRSDPPETPAPIDAAGMGPKSVELAGRFGDGWHGIVLSPDGIADRIDDFERGSELGDRDRSQQRTMVSVEAIVAEDREYARDIARQHLAFYVAAMGDYYREALARQGYEDEANEMAIKWGNGDREGAKAAVTEEILAEFAAVGTPEEAREQLSTFTDIDGLDAVALGFPRAAKKDDIERTIEALAPLAE